MDVENLVNDCQWDSGMSFGGHSHREHFEAAREE